jgi:hypothetical protein
MKRDTQHNGRVLFCLVSFMLSVTYKHLLLSIVMLNVVMMNVIMLCVVILSVAARSK